MQEGVSEMNGKYWKTIFFDLGKILRQGCPLNMEQASPATNVAKRRKRSLEKIFFLHRRVVVVVVSREPRDTRKSDRELKIAERRERRWRRGRKLKLRLPSSVRHKKATTRSVGRQVSAVF